MTVSGNCDTANQKTHGTGCIYIDYHSDGAGLTEKSWSGRTLNANWNIDASRCNSIYGNSDTVQPKSIELYFYIKF